MIQLLLPCCDSRKTTEGLNKDISSSPVLTHAITSISIAIITGIGIGLATYFLSQGVILWSGVAAGSSALIAGSIAYVILRYAFGQYKKSIRTEDRPSDKIPSNNKAPSPSPLTNEVTSEESAVLSTISPPQIQPVSLPIVSDSQAKSFWVVPLPSKTVSNLSALFVYQANKNRPPVLMVISDNGCDKLMTDFQGWKKQDNSTLPEGIDDQLLTFCNSVEVYGGSYWTTEVEDVLKKETTYYLCFWDCDSFFANTSVSGLKIERFKSGEDRANYIRYRLPSDELVDKKLIDEAIANVIATEHLEQLLIKANQYWPCELIINNRCLFAIIRFDGQTLQLHHLGKKDHHNFELNELKRCSAKGYINIKEMIYDSCLGQPNSNKRKNFISLLLNHRVKKDGDYFSLYVTKETIPDDHTTLYSVFYRDNNNPSFKSSLKHKIFLDEESQDQFLKEQRFINISELFDLSSNLIPIKYHKEWVKKADQNPETVDRLHDTIFPKIKDLKGKYFTYHSHSTTTFEQISTIVYDQGVLHLPVSVYNTFVEELLNDGYTGLEPKVFQ